MRVDAPPAAAGLQRELKDAAASPPSGGTLPELYIEVTCVRARGLRKVDLLGKGDPYAVIRWEGWNARKLGKTKTKYNTDKPRWEHACELTVPLQRPGGRVVIEVFDYDAIGADDLLDASFKDFCPSQCHDTGCPKLTPCQAAVELMDKLNALEGNDLPVSAFEARAHYPNATTQYEKRGIALTVPVTDMSKCTQCNKCAAICPHRSEEHTSELQSP